MYVSDTVKQQRIIVNTPASAKLEGIDVIKRVFESPKINIDLHPVGAGQLTLGSLSLRLCIITGTVGVISLHTPWLILFSSPQAQQNH